MADINLVCLTGLWSKWLISCSTCSAGGWMNLSPRSVSGGGLEEMTVTTSGWCDTVIQDEVLQVPFSVL